MPTISPQATVETTKLAEDVVVGPFTYIGPDVRIGAGTVVEGNVIITGRTTLGQNNHVLPGAVIGRGADGTAAKGRIKIGQANSIREHVTIAPGTERPTRIGNSCLIMVACEFGPGAVVGSHAVLTNRTLVAGGATLADYARSGAFASVGADGVVGAYSFVTSYTQVNGVTPPYAMLDGDPCRVRGVNGILLQRCGFGEDDIRALRQAYRDLYGDQTHDPDPQQLERLRSDPNLNPHVAHALTIIEEGARRA